MQELKKIRDVISKVIDHAPHEIYLVIDGNTGQNAIVQAKEFIKVTDITGLIVTKLDGTAKGGALFQISNILNIPIKYIGVGEDIEDFVTQLKAEAFSDHGLEIGFIKLVEDMVGTQSD